MSNATIELDADFPYQDYVLIGGDQSPGRCKVQNIHTPRPWDIRKGYAQTGATVVPQGDDLGTFELRFDLWLPSQVPVWYAFAAKYFDKSMRLIPGTNIPKALSILHPQLSAPPVRITACVVTDATGLLEEEDDLGGYYAIVSCLQYRRPKPALSAPDAKIPAANNPPPTAEDAADAVIQSKLATVQSLASAQGLL